MPRPKYAQGMRILQLLASGRTTFQPPRVGRPCVGVDRPAGCASCRVVGLDRWACRRLGPWGGAGLLAVGRTSCRGDGSGGGGGAGSCLLTSSVTSLALPLSMERTDLPVSLCTRRSACRRFWCVGDGTRTGGAGSCFRTSLFTCARPISIWTIWLWHIQLWHISIWHI